MQTPRQVEGRRRRQGRSRRIARLCHRAPVSRQASRGVELMRTTMARRVGHVPGTDALKRGAAAVGALGQGARHGAVGAGPRADGRQSGSSCPPLYGVAANGRGRATWGYQFLSGAVCHSPWRSGRPLAGCTRQRQRRQPVSRMTTWQQKWSRCPRSSSPAPLHAHTDAAPSRMHAPLQPRRKCQRVFWCQARQQ